MKHVDVIVIGAGVAGQSLANLLAKQGIKVALVEAHEPSIEWPHDSLDARVSAINVASENIFKTIGAWKAMQTSAAPLEQMKVWDGQSGARIDFDSAEMGCAHFGSIIENRVMLKALWQQTKNNENISCYLPAEAISLEVNEHEAKLELNDGSQLSASLIAGADGAHSWLRKTMQIPVNEKSYEQKALVAVIHSEEAHQDTAYQNFLATGPLALLPLKNPHHSAIVWSCDLNYADELMQLDEERFNLALSNASELCLGKLKTLTKPQAIPLYQRHVKHYIKARLALLGDAAHTIHPLAGQGANFGLMDAHYLAGLLIKAKQQGKDLGAYRLLRSYERARKSENEIIMHMMSGFKSFFAIKNPLCVQTRGLGIQALNRATYLKNCMTRYAMGV